MDAVQAGAEEGAATATTSAAGAALESSVFPPPPAEYQLFTSKNPNLTEVLRPPRVDWIEEDGYYSYFGDQWPIPEVHPTLEQQGVTRLAPEGEHDQRDVLQTLLHTLIRTYLELVATLQRPPQEYIAVEEYPVPPAPGDDGSGGAAGGGGGGAAPPPMQRVEVFRSDAQDQWEHIRTTVINMQDTINRLRPVQARESLKMLMQMQLDRRRAQTEHLRSRCAAIRAEIDAMRRACAPPGEEAEVGAAASGAPAGRNAPSDG